MLPNLRMILAAMCLTAILVALVGTALMPRPDPYGRSTVFAGIGQPDNAESRQLRMLGSTRRADELNRLLTLPAPSDDAAAIEGGTSTYVKQGGDTVVNDARVADDSGQRADPTATGSVQEKSTANEPSTPPTSAPNSDAIASSTDAAAKVAGAQPDASETESPQGAPTDPSIAVLPTPRPKLLNAIRHHLRLARSTMPENARGTDPSATVSTFNSPASTLAPNYIDPRSARAKAQPHAAAAPVIGVSPSREINIP